ncbi:hypothetical protein MIDIC_230051 [Alphaproteobacteria bacterium]
MFSVSFSEIALVVLVALLILGPKELVTTMHCVGTTIRYIRSVCAKYYTQMMHSIPNNRNVNKKTIKGKNKRNSSVWKSIHRNNKRRNPKNDVKV